MYLTSSMCSLFFLWAPLPSEVCFGFDWCLYTDMLLYVYTIEGKVKEMHTWSRRLWGLWWKIVLLSGTNPWESYHKLSLSYAQKRLKLVVKALLCLRSGAVCQPCSSIWRFSQSFRYPACGTASLLLFDMMGQTLISSAMSMCSVVLPGIWGKNLAQ